MSDLYQRTSTYITEADVWRGSAAVSVGTYTSSPVYSALGAHMELAITREISIAAEEVDDAESKNMIHKDDVLLKFKWFEGLKDAINIIMFQGMDERVTTSAGASVPASPANDQVIQPGTTINLRYVPLTLGNDDGTIPTITSVTASSSGVLAAGDDYNLAPAPSGNLWQIQFVETGTATVDLSTETITIVWGSLDQTASVTWYTGTGTETNDLSFKLVSSNDGRQVTRTLYKAELESLGDFLYAKDDAEDRRNPQDLVFRCRPDSLYNSGRVMGITIEN
jgi:hypothetical protein